MVLLCRFCSPFIKNFLCTKTFSAVSGPLTLLFLQLFRKQFAQNNIPIASRQLNLFNNVSFGFCKSTVVAGSSLIFFLFISGSLLLVVLGCSGQFLQSPNHSGSSHQNSQRFLTSQPWLPRSAGLVGTLFQTRKLYTLILLHRRYKF